MFAKFFFAITCPNGSSNTGLINSSSLPHACANPGTVTDILNIVFAVVGALAFLMIVIGGFRYILSGGESNKVAESRRMIIYSAVGLIVVSLAAVIVNFVLGKI